MSETRKAGSEEFKQELKDAENRYGGVEDYGSWSDTWDHSKNQQQLKAAGSYDAESELAKKFESLSTDGASRVDDEDGWRELVFDSGSKSASSYTDLVNKWSKAGFDVRAIDMNGGFANSNIAVRKALGEGTGIENPVGEAPEPTPEPTPMPEPEPDKEPGGGGGGTPPDEFLSAFINNSFNAKGGTLTNSGDITAKGDIKLDNSVTNENELNSYRADGFRLNLGELKL